MHTIETLILKHLKQNDSLRMIILSSAAELQLKVAVHYK